MGRTKLFDQACPLSVALATMLQLGCLRPSAFDTDLSDDERNLTSANLAKLAAADRPNASKQTPLTFAFISDTHDGYDEFDAIAAAINARSEIELTLHGGDITDFGTQLEYMWGHESLAKLRTPFVVAPGNHDGLANGRLLYAEMFGPTNFDFAYAGIHFVVVNTNTLEWNMPEPDFGWIERVLNAPGYSATIVVAHQPPRSAPDLSDEVSARLSEMLEHAGVSLFLYGHYHDRFTLGSKRSTVYAKAESALYGSWMVIRADGCSYSFELCRFETCAPTRAPEPAPDEPAD